MLTKQFLASFLILLTIGCAKPTATDREAVAIDIIVAKANELAFQIISPGEQGRVTIQLPQREAEPLTSLWTISIASNGTFVCLADSRMLGLGKLDSKTKALVSFKWMESVRARTFHISVDPTGKRLAFVEFGGGRMNFVGPIVLVDLATGSTKQIDVKALDTGLYWTPDGATIVFSEVVPKSQFLPKEWEAFPDEVTMYDDLTMVSSVEISSETVTRFVPGMPGAMSKDGYVLASCTVETEKSSVGLIEFTVGDFKPRGSTFNVKLYDAEQIISSNPILYWEHDGRTIYVSEKSHWEALKPEGTLVLSEFDGESDREIFRSEADQEVTSSVTVWRHER